MLCWDVGYVYCLLVGLLFNSVDVLIWYVCVFALCFYFVFVLICVCVC